MSLGTRLRINDFAFVTVYAQPPGILERKGAQARLEVFQEIMGEFAAGFDVVDMETKNFSTTVYRVLMAAFKNAFVVRDEATFAPMFRVQYRDSSQMVTVGGCLCPKQNVLGLTAAIRCDLPFLSGGRPYKMRNLHLTDLERRLFDIAVTSGETEADPTKRIKELGFKVRDLASYRDLMRFLPRYHESII